MNWRELAQTYFEAAMMARHSAQGYRRAVKQWPAHAKEDGARATECYERALRYLDDVRYFSARAAATVEKHHERLAA